MAFSPVPASIVTYLGANVNTFFKVKRKKFNFFRRASRLTTRRGRCILPPVMKPAVGAIGYGIVYDVLYIKNKRMRTTALCGGAGLD
jgi:CO dehydrogenase/acetyl-CoA synthase delta subunit